MFVPFCRAFPPHLARSGDMVARFDHPVELRVPFRSEFREHSRKTVLPLLETLPRAVGAPLPRVAAFRDLPVLVSGGGTDPLALAARTDGDGFGR